MADSMTLTHLAAAEAENQNLRSRFDRLHDWASKATDALLKVRPLGGSELFMRVGDGFLADPEYCGKRIDEMRSDLHALRVNAVRLGRVNTSQRDTIADRDRQISSLEAMRPHWAEGYSSDGVAAQVTATALNQLWALLGARNQTEAVQKLKALVGEQEGKAA